MRSLRFQSPGAPASGFESCVSLFPEMGAPQRGRGGGPPASVMPQLSGKFHVLHKMLCKLRATTDDRVVRRSDGAQLSFGVSPYPITLYGLVARCMWEPAIHLCRFVYYIYAYYVYIYIYIYI